ncbi:MAG: hypothetical protein H7A25_00455 [Leptospiraceae bacterium]|nr:hypothetical protein [Leptospiraceae bacterium]MCP5498347.1 hypothetical protein [Leptospiraceae bacterium]
MILNIFKEDYINLIFLLIFLFFFFLVLWIAKHKKWSVAQIDIGSAIQMFLLPGKFDIFVASQVYKFEDEIELQSFLFNEIKENPKSEYWRYVLAEAYVRMQNLPKAKEVLSYLFKTSIKSPTIQKEARVLDTCTRALSGESPKSSQENLVQIYMWPKICIYICGTIVLIDEKEEAIKKVQATFMQSSSNPYYAFALTEIYIRLCDTDNARKMLDKLKEMNLDGWLKEEIRILEKEIYYTKKII